MMIIGGKKFQTHFVARDRDYGRYIGLVIIQKYGDHEYLVEANMNETPLGGNAVSGKETFYLDPDEARQLLEELQREVARLSR